MKTSISRPIITAIFALACSLGVLPANAIDPAAGSAARQRLHQRQLQDRLSLDLQQNLGRNNGGLSQADRHRLDRLQLEQRMQQQRLEMEQMADFQRFAHDPERNRIRQRAYEQARDLQLQQFYVEQQRLLGSITPEPLQPPAQPGQLRLP